jgi:hypothetical protein
MGLKLPCGGPARLPRQSRANLLPDLRQQLRQTTLEGGREEVQPLGGYLTQRGRVFAA